MARRAGCGVDRAPSNTMSELVDLGLALIAGVVVGMVLIGAWIKRGRRRGRMESSAQRAAWEALTKSDETNAARRAEPGCCLN